jgi:hypothetical protein
LPSDGIRKMLEHESFQGNTTLIEQWIAKDMADEKKLAEQWLVDFLKEMKKSISKSFGLTKIKYHRMNNKGPFIRWVCHKCRNDSFQKQMLEDCPLWPQILLSKCKKCDWIIWRFLGLGIMNFCKAKKQSHSINPWKT